MKKVSDILRSKGKAIYSVRPDDIVFDAIKLMVDRTIGAVIVMDGDTLVGILSERDYARKVAVVGKNSRETPVRDIMTAKVMTVSSVSTIEDCMEIMSAKHIRHLPVVDNGKVVGMVSVGDIVTMIIHSQKETIDNLYAYIHS
jgi:CBS domain-containing protein